MSSGKNWAEDALEGLDNLDAGCPKTCDWCCKELDPEVHGGNFCSFACVDAWVEDREQMLDATNTFHEENN